MLGRTRQLLALQHPHPPIGAGRIPQWLVSQGCLFLQRKLPVKSFCRLKMSPVKSPFHPHSVSLWTASKSMKFAPLKVIYDPVGMLCECTTAWSKGDTLCGQREVQFLPSFPTFFERLGPFFLKSECGLRQTQSGSSGALLWSLPVEWPKPPRRAPLRSIAPAAPAQRQALPSWIKPVARGNKSEDVLGLWRRRESFL